MIRRPPRSTRTDTLFPYTTLFRSSRSGGGSRSRPITAMCGSRWRPMTPTLKPLWHDDAGILNRRSEEHTSELQSLMRISYAVFCLKKKTHKSITTNIVTKSPVYAILYHHSVCEVNCHQSTNH